MRGEIELDDLADREVDDLLDDVRELVLKNRGRIVIVPAERMPAQTGIAPSIPLSRTQAFVAAPLQKPDGVAGCLAYATRDPWVFVGSD